MTEKQYYRENFRVTDCDCDWNNLLMPGALMRMVQQIATDQCAGLGMDEAFYQKNGAGFMLARMAIQIDRAPKAGETITLQTMPETAHRALYKRVTLVFDADGKQIAMVDSRWILVDIATRRILRRPPSAFTQIPFDEDVPYELEMGIVAPAEIEECGNVRADYSRCDTNRHMNNTRYVDVAMDALPQEELAQRPVKGIALHYHHELPAGQSAALMRHREPDGSWYVRGVRDSHNCFEAVIRF